MSVLLALSCLLHNALASNLIGNPTVRLPTWLGETVETAHVTGLRWRFVSATGIVKTVQSGSCDLAEGCTVVAPFSVWVELRVYVSSGSAVETDADEFILGGSTVTWVDVGAPVSWQGPSSDTGLMGMRMWLPQ